jgi:membrane-bound lytic murein transglycosylase D
LASIANKLGVSRGDLAEANGVSVKAAVRPGQRLLIPRAPSAPLLASAPRAVDATPVLVNASRTTTADADDDVRVVTHRVKRGETLYAIANTYDVTVADLRTWNRMKGTRLDIGDRLTVRVNRAPARSAAQ